MLGIKERYLKDYKILCQNKAIKSAGNHGNGVRLYMQLQVLIKSL